MSNFLDQTSFLAITCIFEKREPFLDRLLAEFSDMPTSRWSVNRDILELGRIYSVRPPYGGNRPLRAVMWTPRTLPDQTAFFINSRDGWSHFFSKMSQSGGPASVTIRSTLPDEDGGIQSFLYRKEYSKDYDPTRLLQWLEEENGYEFMQIGEPLAFEEANKHNYSPIKNRSDLLAFVRKFGIDLEADEFWETDGDAIYLNQTWLRSATE